MYCPDHETFGAHKNCYYCNTTLEEHLYLQKLRKDIENVKNKRVLKHQLREAGSDVNASFVDEVTFPSYVYHYRNDYEWKIISSSSQFRHRIEVIPHPHVRTSDALDLAHDCICEQASHEKHFEVPEAYLRYLAHRIQPQDFCTTEELCLFPEREET